jgi:predicted kinase
MESGPILTSPRNGIVERGYQKNNEGENGCKHAAQDEMHMDLHVLQPDQETIQQRAESDHPS